MWTKPKIQNIDAAIPIQGLYNRVSKGFAGRGNILLIACEFITELDLGRPLK
jgi:hypothetical protein